MMVLDEQENINKAQKILTQRDTFIPIMVDPTNKHKNRIINLLRIIKAQDGLEDNTYKRLSNSHRPENFYGLPKKAGYPLRPVVSGRGMVTYGMVKGLVNILRPPVSHSTITSGTLSILYTTSSPSSHRKGSTFHPVM